MIERIRDGLWYLKLRLSCLKRRPRLPGSAAVSAVKGVMRPVIVVKPESPMFEQAMFFLSDEYLSRHGADSEEILSQARAVVEDYTRRQTEYGGRRGRGLVFLFFAAVFFLLAAFGFYAYWL